MLMRGVSEKVSNRPGGFYVGELFIEKELSQGSFWQGCL